METEGLIAPSDPVWMAFIKNKPQASIFHHPAWSQLLVETYGYQPFISAIFNPDGTLAAGVPMMEVNSPVTGKRWVSLPFSDYCDPLSDDDQALRNLTLQILELASNKHVLKTELRSAYPKQTGLYPFSEHVLHLAELEDDCDKVLSRVHGMHRRNLKQAITSQVEIVRAETLTQLHEFYDLHLRTRRSQGVPVQPLRFFENLKQILLDQELGFLLLAYKDQRCIAGAVFLHWQKRLTYKYGASSDDGLQYRPNNLLMWTAMQWGCEHGYTCFDMGRSDPGNAGLRTFKSRWGAQESTLEYTSLTPLPIRNEKNRFMGLMESVVQISPLWVCRLTGELLYKHFG